MMPFDAYRCYLSLKNHFTKDHYDYYKNEGRTRVKKETFYKRKDRFWFERFARQKNDKEVVDFFVSNFVSTTDPSQMYIREMIKTGEDRYVDWKKRTQSLSYVFKEESESLFKDKKVDEIFDCSQGHPIVLKKFNSCASYLIFSFKGFDISLGTDCKSMELISQKETIASM